MVHMRKRRAKEKGKVDEDDVADENSPLNEEIMNDNKHDA
jgi:hypothetical protein